MTHAAFNRTGDRIVTCVLRQDRTHLGRLERYRDCSLEGPRGTRGESRISVRTEAVSLQPPETAPRASGMPLLESSFLCFEPVGNFPTAVFDPNGNRVLTAGENSHASLWDARTGTKVLSVEPSTWRWLGWLQSGWSQLCDLTSDGRSSSGMPTDGTLIQEWHVGTWPIHAHIQPGRKSAADRLVGHNFIRQLSRPLGRVERNRDRQTGRATRATPNCRVSRSVTTAAELQRSRSMAAHESGTASREACLTCSARSPRTSN